MGFSQLPRAAHLSDLERIRAKPRSPNSNHALRRRNFAEASASPRRSPCLFRRARPLSGVLSVEAFTVSRCSLLQRQRLCFALLSLSGVVARRGPYGPLRPASGAARTRPGRALDAPRMCPGPAPDVRRTPGAGRRRTQVEFPGHAGRATDEASNGAGRGRRRRTRVRTRLDTDAGLPDATFRAGPSTGLVSQTAFTDQGAVSPEGDVKIHYYECTFLQRNIRTVTLPYSFDLSDN